MKIKNTNRLYRVYKYKNIPTLLSVMGHLSVISVCQWIPCALLRTIFEIRKKIVPNLSDANPCDLKYVDPNEIDRIYTGPHTRLGEVQGGDWDRHSLKLIEDHPIYQSIHNHFEKGIEWEKTWLYEIYHRQITNNDPNWKCPTEKHLKNYLEQIESLYSTIQKKGYKSQREMLRGDSEATRKSNNDTFHPVLNEVGVNISRKGKFMKTVSGDHRLAIAQTLDLDSIPVIVRTRHKHWQQLRDKLINTKAPDELSQSQRKLLDHPDLENIIDKYS